MQEIAAGEVLHEPMNRDHGISGVPIWYPYHPGGETDDVLSPFAKDVERLTDDFFLGRSKYVRQLRDGPIHRRIGRRLLKSSMERGYRRAFTAGEEKQIILKDPFSLFCIPYLVEKHSARVVIIVRHPGALLVSMRRMGWSSIVPSLIEQPGLLSLAKTDKKEALAILAQSDVVQNAWSWKISQVWTRHLLAKYPGNVIFVRHEDLSLEREGAVEKLLAHLELSAHLAGARNFIRETTVGGVTAPEDGVLHEAKRDGASLVSYWQTRLTDQEKVDLANAVGEELAYFFPEKFV
mgnify:CR=1 FL=1